MSTDAALLTIVLMILGGAALREFFLSLDLVDHVLYIIVAAGALALSLTAIWSYFSTSARENRKRLKDIQELPQDLKLLSKDAVFLGHELDLNLPIYLPDHIRRRHVHVLGATGSGKTESVILNFLKQDTERGIGAIILDAKGDRSFLSELEKWVPAKRLAVFDLGDKRKSPFDPIKIGDPIESAQRLFSSLTWSEEYYKSKAATALMLLFQNHHQQFALNPTLRELSQYLATPLSYISATQSRNYPEKLADQDYSALSGLKDQIKLLTLGHLADLLSPKNGSSISLASASDGMIIYFRLQSLISPTIVSILGKLLINNLSYLAGQSHREETKQGQFVPVYLDEFASFACPEFADLISKSRSAGYALHFSHQSICDLAEVSKGFLGQITDNSGTKIVLRINDPDTAEFFARSFGTRLYQKITQRITNVKTIDRAEVVGEGTQREAHQFRAAPDLFKTHPTGVGSVLIAHGNHTPHGASSVFRIQFPRLET